MFREYLTVNKNQFGTKIVNQILSKDEILFTILLVNRYILCQKYPFSVQFKYVQVSCRQKYWLY